MILNAATFQPAATQDETCAKYGWQKGTIEATLDGRTERVAATNYGDKIVAGGFVAKYETGKKLWPASVTLRGAAESIFSGFDSRSGRHHMAPTLWFRSAVADETLIAKR